MKKLFLLLFGGVIFFSGIKAQDTIPFLDPCFSQSVLCDESNNYALVDHSVLIGNPYTATRDIGTSNHHYFPQHISTSGTSICGIATISNQIGLPENIILGLFSYNASTGLHFLDSIHGRENLFHKRMFYTFPDSQSEDRISIVPCNIFLFNSRVQVPDTFYVGHINNNQENYSFFCYGAPQFYLNRDDREMKANIYYNTQTITPPNEEYDYPHLSDRLRSRVFDTLE